MYGFVDEDDVFVFLSKCYVDIIEEIVVCDFMVFVIVWFLVMDDL